MTQMVHNHFFIMTEIGRITVPEALPCLHSFITEKPPYIIARHPFFGIAVTFLAAAYPTDTSFFPPSASLHITELLHMINNIKVSWLQRSTTKSIWTKWPNQLKK